MDDHGSDGSAHGARESVLVVEAGEFARQRLKSALRSPDREVWSATSAREGLAALRDARPDLVVLSLELPDIPGTRVISLFRERSQVPVVAVSEVADVRSAVEALRHGATDYIGLDDGRSRLLEVLVRALQEGQSNRELRQVQGQVRDNYGFTRLVSQSPRMLGVFDQVRAVAQTEATVLIRGETGTGKELVSRAIHDRSNRKDKPFVAVNCGAFTDTLLESELFGHERGAFTGAVGKREGLFEMANGGTLFLDELGETSLSVQVNLLRVLETMSFRRVGGRDEVHVDVRIVAATNVGLEEAIVNKEFREDLYYRLNVFPISLPPLRRRPEDIPLLMRHFLDEFSEEYDVDPPVIAAEALPVILAYRWPGNVRQLRAMCERWVITRHKRRLELEHLPSGMSGKGRASEEMGSFAIEDRRSMKQNVDVAVAQVERAYLQKVLQRCDGHLTRAATEAGVTRRTLYSKMKSYGLEATDFKRDDS